MRIIPTINGINLQYYTSKIASMVDFINLLGNKYESNPNLGIQNFFIGSTSILPNKNLTETFAGMKRN